MDSDVVIRATGLGKHFTIGHQGGKVGTLRDAITGAFSALARTTGDMLHGRAIIAGETREQFWALRDINFEVRRGEVLGIIGRNGAGKSTLLKLLSRITDPSEGRIEIRGRVASLLEVGTGFHPELTGRENIFLNGAILGMTRAEIRRKFDEIVAFAEVERFLDTPVKRYSSGMYVRLAFAVAAHLEPEILIVDEVLAVGDAEFQKKCLGKMQDVAGQGRTVLFVSHQLGMVSRLCESGIHLSSGQIALQGTMADVIDSYLNEAKTTSIGPRSDRASATPHILDIRTCDEAGQPKSDFLFDERIAVSVLIGGLALENNTLLSVTLASATGSWICSEFVELSQPANDDGKVEVTVKYPSSVIAPKEFSFRVALSSSSGEVFDVYEISCPVKIIDNGSRLAKFESFDYGHVILDCEVLQKSLS